MSLGDEGADVVEDHRVVVEMTAPDQPEQGLDATAQPRPNAPADRRSSMRASS